MENQGMPLLGDLFPEMKVQTTRGTFELPKHFAGKWFVLFSHPADFTPVCTTEFVAFQKRYDKFMQTFNEISNHFSQIYKDMMNGVGTLRLEEENNISSGLMIEASPAAKKVLNIDSMSGGEKTMTSLAFLFGVMHYYAAPFYVLDEVDAALDKANTKKISDLAKKYSDSVQIIVITHNDLMI